MLNHLYIKNYILIDEINLSFDKGFSAFTGETGAGKSILIDAIGILGGDRFTTDLIRSSQEKCILEANFTSTHPEVIQLIEAQGIDFDQHELIITRELHSDGRSLNRLNGRSVPVGFLKSLSTFLFDIHSQHDNQSLLNNKTHLNLLDAFEGCDELEPVQNLYKAYKRISDELKDKQENSLNPDDLEFLEFQRNEIEAANLSMGEDEQLEQRQKSMMAFEKNSLKLQTALDLLEESDGISIKMHELIKQLKSVDGLPEIESKIGRLDELYYELLDYLSEIKIAQSQLNYDEFELNSIQERIFNLNKLKKKYGRTIEDIFTTYDEIKSKIELIENRFVVLERLEREKAAAYASFKEKAHSLSKTRKIKAERLETAILNQCKDLYLEKAQFKIDFKENDGSQTGIDTLEFLISMNPGESLKPLNKVASGGELSRLMLGLKVVFNQLQSIDTIIFDEIDSGVSGRVASSIGQKMVQLGTHAQVFSVTHLGQVAACAAHHYFVSKAQGSLSTQSKIEKLNKEGRVRELSLISSGSLSEASILAAQELLESAQNKQ